MLPRYNRLSKSRVTLDMAALCMRIKIRAIAGPIALFALVACSVPSSTPTASGPEGAAGTEGPAKTLAIAQLNLTKGFGPWGFASTSGGGASMGEIHTVSLTSE